MIDIEGRQIVCDFCELPIETNMLEVLPQDLVYWSRGQWRLHFHGWMCARSYAEASLSESEQRGMCLLMRIAGENPDLVPVIDKDILDKLLVYRPKYTHKCIVCQPQKGCNQDVSTMLWTLVDCGIF